MKYPHVVTFQSPTETRTASGGVAYDYDDVEDLSDLPCRIVPMQEEDQDNRMVLESDRFTIIVQGDRAIDRPMRAVSSFLDAMLDVIRVQRPVLYGSAASYATIVDAQLIRADAEAGS